MIGLVYRFEVEVWVEPPWPGKVQDIFNFPLLNWSSDDVWEEFTFYISEPLLVCAIVVEAMLSFVDPYENKICCSLKV